MVGGKPHHFTYASVGWKDQLIDFDGKSITYDSMGRPTSIDGMTAEFNGRGLMTRLGDIKFAYDIDGVRKNVSTTSGEKIFLTIGNKILKEVSKGALNYELTFEYAMDKLTGFRYNDVKYFFVRNIQGDIQRIYRKDNCELVAEYVYDAWGNHIVLDANGIENIDPLFIGNINPFRYRGYYFDRETNLYYLNSRYYSPELCRFISPDTLSILDETHAQINGLNLYMYCNDNPIMYSDETGYMPNWLKWVIGGVAFAGAVALTIVSGGALAPVFIGMATSIIGGGLINGTISAINGNDFWSGFADGAADGALWGGIFALGGATIGFVKNFQLIKSRGVVIGKGMDRVGYFADQAALSKYTPMKGYNFIRGNGKSAWRVNLADKLSIAHNKAWINRVMRLKKPIYDIGLGAVRDAGTWYSMELKQVAKYALHILY